MLGSTGLKNELKKVSNENASQKLIVKMKVKISVKEGSNSSWKRKGVNIGKTLLWPTISDALKFSCYYA